MKKLIWMLSALVATSAGAGGIGVTNGNRVHSLSGFTVQYAPELTLHKASATSFDISNPELVQVGEPVSKISFTVARVPGKKLVDVKSELQKRFPAKDILEMQQPGAKGFYWEERSTASLTGHYNLLTSNGDLVDIELEAFAAGDGLRWVAPIVHSLVYDATAPVILEMQLENRVWEAGSTQKLRLRITDDYAGVKPEFTFSLEAPSSNAKDKSDRAYYFVSAKLIPEGNDWYTAILPISEYLPGRNFLFSNITLSDEAGNQRELRAELGDTHYTASPAMPEKNLPTLSVQVVNRGREDAAPPRVLGFRADSTVWEVGSTHRVYFKLTDDVSGVSLSDVKVGISQPCSLFLVNGEKVCNGESGGEFVRYRAEGNDWYSAEYTVRKYLPSGEYRIGAIVTDDKAGNLRMIFPNDQTPTAPGLVPVFKVTIRNGGQEDLTPPTITDWKVDSTSWKAGENAKIYLRVSDEVAGVRLADMNILFQRVDGAEVATVSTDPRSVTAEGDNWYSMKVPVNQFLQAGFYYPSFVMAKDRAANQALLDCKPDGSCQVRKGDAIRLAPLTVEVVR